MSESRSKHRSRRRSSRSRSRSVRRHRSRSADRRRRPNSRSRSRDRRRRRGASPPKPNPDLIKKLLAQQQAGANPMVTRQARRIYAGNLPIGAGFTEPALIQFFTNAAIAAGITTPNPVVSVWCSTEGSFCFVECRAVSDATRCIERFDGLQIGGRPLRIGRPADYAPAPEHLETYVMDVAGLPPAPEDCTGRQPAGSTAAPHLPMSAITYLPSSGPPAPQESGPPPTQVLLLLNMCERDDMLDDEEYQDIKLDIRGECEKFGPVDEVWIPRPSPEGVDHDPPGIGKIFVMFSDVDHAVAARTVLKKRVFSGRPVSATFFPFQKFLDKETE